MHISNLPIGQEEKHSQRTTLSSGLRTQKYSEPLPDFLPKFLHHRCEMAFSSDINMTVLDLLCYAVILQSIYKHANYEWT